jgi:sugar lactone lactonase YvrE
VVDSGNNAVKKVNKDTGAVLTTLASGLNGPSGIAYDGTNLYVTDSGNDAVLKLDKNNGNLTTLAIGGSLHHPSGVTCDGTYLYVTDANAVHQIDIASGSVTDLAGNETVGYTDSISGKTPLFNGPMGITTDDNYLYITDSGNNTIRMLQ